MEYCYQCKNCGLDYEFPPSDKDCWCSELIKSINYKDNICDNFEQNKELGKIDHPEYSFDKKFSKFISYYFRNPSEPKVVYQILECYDSIIVYRIIDPRKCFTKMHISNKKSFMKNFEGLEFSINNIDWKPMEEESGKL